MEVAEFNALTEDDATRLVSGFLGVPRWVREVVAGRPYADPDTLEKQAHDSALDLTDAELDQALARHPRIGEKTAARPTSTDESAYSSREQAGVQASDAERLRAGNAAYEARFGHVFLIRAAGRSSAEILTELDRRLGNDDATERAETVTALRDIALLRLGQAVTGPVTEA